MFLTIFLAFIAFLIALLPVYLWGYGVSYLLDTPWNRRRFLLGMMIWGMSVFMVWLFSYVESDSLYIVLALSIFVFLLALILYTLIWSGSAYARILLQQFATVNMMIIVVLLTTVLISTSILPGGAIVALSVTPLLISSLIEESSKHLMSIGLMSQDFAFSRRDIIIFTLFVVLGFVFAENILYLLRSDLVLSTWIFRSFFSLTAHLLAASICAYAWWRALSYEPYSVRYVAIFSTWFAIAVLTHLGYNLILQQGSMIWLFAYMIVGYVVVTRGMLVERATV